MILNNHLYNLHFKKIKNNVLNNVFKKYINLENDSDNNEFYLNTFTENINLVKKIIQSLDNDNLNFSYMSYQIINIFFNHNELYIKKLPEMFDVLIELLIYIELIIHIHILILNIYFFDNNILTKYINVTFNNEDKTNNYLMLIEILINICNIFEKHYNKLQTNENRIILDYLEENKGSLMNVLNFNLDNTIIQILNNLDNSKNENSTSLNNKNVLVNMISNMFNHFKNNIMNLIEIFIKLFEKKEIFIPDAEKKNIFIIISTVFNYNIVKLKS